MLFNSYQFIFGFLPLTLICFIWLRTLNNGRIAVAWLGLSSLFFYGYRNWAYLPLLIFSILINFAFGQQLCRRGSKKRFWIAIGVAFNISLLGYYKYSDFFISNLFSALGQKFLSAENIILPLAISFFTFQQIAYLIAVYRDNAQRNNLLNYIAFVSFFPQLIAGPIVRKQELLPQIAGISEKTTNYCLQSALVGLCLFVIGLFKKTVLADNFAIYSDPIFASASNGNSIGFVDGWGGSLAYTFQLYFDFSGYSDMALGLALMFGVILPINFFSPYKATSIIDFWRRWHITLSQFFRDYVYVPLGGSSKGFAAQVVNLFVVMVLVGFWHGAGWTFIAWGCYHGVLLALAHFYKQSAFNKVSQLAINKRAKLKPLFWFLTFFAVVCGWVLFRATSFQVAASVLSGMFFMNGFATGHANYDLFDAYVNYGLISIGFIIVLTLPNSFQLLPNRYRTAYQSEYRFSGGLARKLKIKINFQWMLVTACLFYGCLSSIQSATSKFLYFNF